MAALAGMRMERKSEISDLFELAGECAEEAFLNLTGQHDLPLEGGEPGILPSLVLSDSSKKQHIGKAVLRKFRRADFNPPYQTEAALTSAQSPHVRFPGNRL
jgi:hypothetical protein